MLKTFPVAPRPDAVRTVFASLRAMSPENRLALRLSEGPWCQKMYQVLVGGQPVATIEGRDNVPAPSATPGRHLVAWDNTLSEGIDSVLLSDGGLTAFFYNLNWGFPVEIAAENGVRAMDEFDCQDW